MQVLRCWTDCVCTICEGSLRLCQLTDKCEVISVKQMNVTDDVRVQYRGKVMYIMRLFKCEWEE